jgi:hypothetical protein
MVDFKGTAVVQLILDHGKLRPRDVISRLSNDDVKGTPTAAINSCLRFNVFFSFGCVLSDDVQARDTVLS